MFKHCPFEGAAFGIQYTSRFYFSKIEKSWFHNSICVIYVPVKCTFHLVAGIVRVEAHDVLVELRVFFLVEILRQSDRLKSTTPAVRTWGQDCREAGQMWCWNGGYGPVLFSSASLSCMVLSVASDEYSARLHPGGWVQSPVTTVFRVFKTNYKVSMFCGCWRWQTCFRNTAFREHGRLFFFLSDWILPAFTWKNFKDGFKMGVSQNGCFQK